MDDLSFRGDGDDGWTATDVSELYIDSWSGGLTCFGGHCSWGRDSRRDDPFPHYAISPNTVVADFERPRDPFEPVREKWIFTFEDLPA